MQRSVDINVVASTWPTPPAMPAFPAGFHKGVSTVAISVPQMLHAIGLLTTPTEPVGPTLSQYWAYVRYVTAVTNDPDLRITASFAALDSHQKTILSDDFGMGLPMYWLWGKLNAYGFCDGQYFIKALASAFGFVAPKKAKRGPNKSPDFVVRDMSGKWHVIECKGTQSGDVYRDRQLGKATPKPSGGVQQKASIIIPAPFVGQRMACGLSIGVEGGPFATNLKIVDPTRPKKFIVEEGWLDVAKEIVVRATLARALRLAGFEATAAYIAANGPVPLIKRIRKRARLDYLETLRGRAATELATRDAVTRASFGPRSDPFVGRAATFDLSQGEARLDLAGQVEVQQGISREFAAILAQTEIGEGRRERLAPQVLELATGINFSGEGEESRLAIGRAFQSVRRLKAVQQTLT